MTFNNPTVAEFKTYFSRDFPYGTDPATSVLDADIVKAFGQTNFAMNQALFADQDQYTIAYMLLAAHWLVIDLQNSSQGIAANGTWLEQSKSAGNVSQSFSIPQRILDDPYMSALSKTGYGQKYLTLLLPQLAGNFGIAYGRTLP